MAGIILNELLLLLKQQADLNTKLTEKLLKSEKLVEFSSKETTRITEAMASALQYLPEQKQQELNEIVQIICQSFEVGMIILFGSYARGDWVEEYAEDGVHFKYQSDFDLLVIVSNTCKHTEQKILERSIFKAVNKSTNVKTPISVIVHNIDFVNCHLKKAQYFFSDIKKEGITIYDSGKFTLEKEIKIHKKERYLLAKNDFEYCFNGAKDFYEVFNFCFENNKYSKAAFLLHQATEQLYTCILLVFKRYKPNSHKLELLKTLTNNIDKRFITVFSLKKKEEMDRFTLLCKAYVDARYDKNYTISQDELRLLSEEVIKLMRLTEIVCQEKINSFLGN